MKFLINLIPPQYRLMAAGFVVALALSAAAGAGWTANGWRLGNHMKQLKLDIAEAVQKSKEQADRITVLSSDLAIANSDLLTARQAALDAQATIVTREVIKYVQAPYSGHCNLPKHWVRVDTAAARGLPEDGAAGRDDDAAPSGFTDADALQVNVERSRICRREIEKLAHLQIYVRQQLSLFSNGARNGQ